MLLNNECYLLVKAHVNSLIIKELRLLKGEVTMVVEIFMVVDVIVTEEVVLMYRYDDHLLVIRLRNISIILDPRLNILNLNMFIILILIKNYHICLINILYLAATFTNCTVNSIPLNLAAGLSLYYLHFDKYTPNIIQTTFTKVTITTIDTTIIIIMAIIIMTIVIVAAIITVATFKIVLVNVLYTIYFGAIIEHHKLLVFKY